MKKRKLFTLVGSICLVLVLAALLLPACAKPVPPAPAPVTPAPAPVTPAPAPVTPAPAPAPVEVKPVILRYSATSSSTGLRPTHMKAAADEVERVTDGRVKIEFYWSGSLLGIKDNLKGVQKGVADMATVFAVYNPAELPLNNYQDGPMAMVPSCTDDYVLVKQTWEAWDQCKPLRDEFAQWDQTNWYFYCTDGFGCFAQKPITKLADFAKLRIRVPGAGAAIMVEAVGGIPTFTTSAEVFEALQKGVVDATLGALEYGQRVKLDEVTDYLNLTDVIWYTSQYTVSFAALEKMSEQDRDAFLEVGRSFSLQYAEAVRDGRQEIIKSMEEKGMTVVPFPQEEKEKWAALPEVKGILKDWIDENNAAGRPGTEVMEIITRVYEVPHFMP